MNKKFGASPIRSRESKSLAENSKGYYTDHPCDDVFNCAVCGYEIHPEGAGSDHRNHCPKCLSSIHLDITPGDRASDCHGIMDPIAVWVRDNGEWALIHRCRSCGALSSNRIAADDNPAKLMSVATKAAKNPPFPVERLDDMCKALGYDPDEA